MRKHAFAWSKITTFSNSNFSTKFYCTNCSAQSVQLKWSLPFLCMLKNQIQTCLFLVRQLVRWLALSLQTLKTFLPLYIGRKIYLSNDLQLKFKALSKENVNLWHALEAATSKPNPVDRIAIWNVTEKVGVWPNPWTPHIIIGPVGFMSMVECDR
jgi:hypothetical protein